MGEIQFVPFPESDAGLIDGLRAWAIFVQGRLSITEDYDLLPVLESLRRRPSVGVPPRHDVVGGRGVGVLPDTSFSG